MKKAKGEPELDKVTFTFENGKKDLLSFGEDDYHLKVNMETGQAVMSYPKREDFSQKEVNNLLNILVQQISVVALWRGLAPVQLGLIVEAECERISKLDKAKTEKKKSPKKGKK